MLVSLAPTVNVLAASDAIWKTSPSGSITVSPTFTLAEGVSVASAAVPDADMFVDVRRTANAATLADCAAA